MTPKTAVPNVMKKHASPVPLDGHQLTQSPQDATWMSLHALMPFAPSLQPRDVPNVAQDSDSPRRTQKTSLIALPVPNKDATPVPKPNVPHVCPDSSSITRPVPLVLQSPDVLLAHLPPLVPPVPLDNSRVETPVPLVELDVQLVTLLTNVPSA